jgi:hypothetical protein
VLAELFQEPVTRAIADAAEPQLLDQTVLKRLMARSTRPLAAGELAQITSTLRSCIAQPNCV